MGHRSTPGFVAAAVGVSVILWAAACANSDDNSAASTAVGDPAAGEQTYGDFCGACHGRDFEGSVQGPSQLDAVFEPATTTDADFRSAIRNGVEETNYDYGNMPPIRSLDDQRIADVIAYVRSVQEERGFNDS